MKKQIGHLLKGVRVSGRDRAKMMKVFGERVDRERKKAFKRLESRLKELQSRIGKERKVVARMVDDAVKGTLAALNIPSRAEVAELTRSVATLSRKIDSFKRRR